MTLAGRKRLIVAVAVVLGAAAAVYGYNVYRNVSARSRADAACDRFISATRTTQKATHPWLSRVFPDAATVERDNIAGAGDLCRGVQGRLTWWRWNLGGADYQPPRDGARDRRLRVALDAAAKRCPIVSRKILDASPYFQKPPKDDKEKAKMELQKNQLVIGMCSTYKDARSRLDEPTPGLSIWDWPERLERLATSAEMLAGKRPHAPPSAR